MTMSELVDLADKDGQIQLHAVPLHEAKQYYSEGLYLQIAIAVIFDSFGRVLAQRRAQTKKSDKGKIDHACGVVSSGETPLETASREVTEETGLRARNLQLVDQRVNSYRRFRYLFVGESEGKPGPVDLQEVEWAKFLSPEDLCAKQASGDWEYVGEFFEDLELASSELKRES